MSVRLSCPSCNTAFALPAVPADRRATCPRCGDAFPVRWELADQPTNAEADPPAALPNAKYELRTPRYQAGMWSIRRTALVVLALGLLGFVVGLTAYHARAPK